MSSIPNPKPRTELTTRAAGYPKIETDDQMREAKSLLEVIEDVMGEIHDSFDEHIKAAHRAHKAILATRSGHLAPLDEAAKRLKRLLGDYRNMLNRQALERAKQARLEAEAERSRLAEQLRLEGVDAESARQVAAAEVVPEIPRADPVSASEAGVAIIERWRGRVTDVRKLCRHIAEGKAPVELVKVDEGAVNRWAAMMKGAARIGGVELWIEKTQRRVR